MSAGGGAGRTRVLVADDHALIVRVLQRSLEEAGYDTVVETDGEQVADTALRERPDLALVDANMPPGKRFDALRALGALSPDARPAIIVLTGEDDPAVRARALELGAEAFLMKPWDPDELFELIEQLVAARRGAA